MVFDRPPRPGKSQSSATQRPPSKNSNKKRIITSNNQGGDRGNGGNYRRDDRPPEGSPSPWLEHPHDPAPIPGADASFVEYLRWMRSPDSEEKDSTKVQILQMAMKNANYNKMLSQRTKRTRQMAGEKNCFELACPWRIRVGGQRGPESILLPAFDAIGMPYIPSATLRGVARTQAIRGFMQKDGCDWKQAEKKIAPWFGSLDEKGSDRTGKVIFFDAYPLPASEPASGNMDQDKNQNGGGLTLDMANNIWQWSGDELDYKSNPNPFLSLHKPNFVMGLRPMNGSVSDSVLTQVRQWLIAGLVKGIGSQVNTGYGVLGSADNSSKPFLQVPFTVKGQLMHGYQTMRWKQKNGDWKPDTSSRDELRPIALKSMMRYWFRAFAEGVLHIGNEQEVMAYRKALSKTKNVKPPATVKALEAILFGSITPQCWGWLTIRVDGETIQSSPGRRGEPCGMQVGNLSLLFSPEMPQQHTQAVQDLCKALVWLMFHLGGLGQGARRPCYSRQSRQYAPWYRGSTIVQGVHDSYHEQYGTTLVPDEDNSFWELPERILEFRDVFHKRLKAFYSALEALTTSTISYKSAKVVKNIRNPHEWVEAVDKLCRIVVVKELADETKPTALHILHKQFHELDQNDLYNAKNLCGHTKKDKIPPLNKQKGIIKKADKQRQRDRKAIHSPVWISNLEGKYQVATVFGASQNPRKQFLEALETELDSKHIAQLWPIV